MLGATDVGGHAQELTRGIGRGRRRAPPAMCGARSAVAGGDDVTRKNAEPARLAPLAAAIRTRAGLDVHSIALGASMVAAHSAKKGGGASRAATLLRAVSR